MTLCYLVSHTLGAELTLMVDALSHWHTSHVFKDHIDQPVRQSAIRKPLISHTLLLYNLLDLEIHFGQECEELHLCGQVPSQTTGPDPNIKYGLGTMHVF